MSYQFEPLILKTLGSVKNPLNGKSITESLSKIVVEGKSVFFSIYIEAAQAPLYEKVKVECEQKIGQLKLFDRVSVTLASAPKSKGIPGVGKIVIVASGKGGVGKSTIAFALAKKLAATGYKTGLVDADIYGPSLPVFTGITEKPYLEGDMMVPHEVFGLKLMSIGFLVDGKSAAVWRGPMVTKALYQLMRVTKWGELDYLVVDTPPGTGDVHLSLAENYIIDGALIVTTPQGLSLADARKGIDMYRKLSVPIIGVIENMSFYEADGKRHYIFGKDEGVRLASEANVPLLAQIPVSNSTEFDLGVVVPSLVKFVSGR